MTSPASEHHLLVTHASRWAETKKRPLDTELLELVLHLVATYDERSAQSWPTGSARNLVLHRLPANAPADLPDTDALLATLDTFWRFLRSTGRMTSASAAPADLVKELRRAFPQMRDAMEDRSNWSQGRVLQEFGAGLGIDLDGADSMEELQGRLDSVMTAWNELPAEERKRLMPDPSPKSAMGASATAMMQQAMASGAVGGDPDDPASVYPHYRRGIRAVAIREAEESGFEAKVAALLEWLGEGKAVTSTGVLRPALAREAYAALELAPWERQYEDARHGRLPRVELTPEAEELDAQARAAAISRAADCVALERIWWAAERSGRIVVGSKVARPTPPDMLDGPSGPDRLVDALTLLVAVLELFDGEHLDVLAYILISAMIAPDGEINLDDVREEWWDRSGYAARHGDDPETLDLLRSLTNSRVDECVAVHDDLALWTRRGDELTVTDYGREASMVVTKMADGWEDGS